MIVLLAEDETMVRMVAAEMRREEGSFNVIEAADADQALTVLEATTNVQALVTDVEMPGSLDGFTLARLVRQAWPHIGIVVTSGRVRPGPKDLPSGTLFIAKPYSLAALVDAVRTVLHPPQAGNSSKTSVPMLPAGSNVGQPDTGIGISRAASHSPFLRLRNKNGIRNQTAPDLRARSASLLRGEQQLGQPAPSVLGDPECEALHRHQRRAGRLLPHV